MVSYSRYFIFETKKNSYDDFLWNNDDHSRVSSIFAYNFLMLYFFYIE